MGKFRFLLVAAFVVSALSIGTLPAKANTISFSFSASNPGGDGPVDGTAGVIFNAGSTTMSIQLENLIGKFLVRDSGDGG